MMKSNKLKNSKKIKPGDIVYFEGPNGIEKETVMFVDGQEITTSDLGYLHKKDILDENDPRVIDFIKKS